MLRAVVDPGVLISALISPSGAPADLVRRWLGGYVQFVWSPSLLEEFETVCSRTRFRQWFTVEEGQTIAAIIRDAGERCDDAPASTSPPPDDGDAYVVDLAVAANVDCLVTRDAALLNHEVAGLRVVTPRALLDVLDDIEGQRPQ